MWGKNKDDNDYTCLEIGESQTIIYELYIDIALLNYGLSQFVFLKDTSNVPCKKLSETFGNFSKQFYKVKGEERRTAKYRDIAVNYDELIIYEYCFESTEKSESKEARTIQESHMALEYRAIYWNFTRNNKIQYDALVDYHNKHSQDKI